MHTYLCHWIIGTVSRSKRSVPTSTVLQLYVRLHTVNDDTRRATRDDQGSPSRQSSLSAFAIFCVRSAVLSAGYPEGSSCLYVCMYALHLVRSAQWFITDGKSAGQPVNGDLLVGQRWPWISADGKGMAKVRYLEGGALADLRRAACGMRHAASRVRVCRLRVCRLRVCRLRAAGVRLRQFANTRRAQRSAAYALIIQLSMPSNCGIPIQTDIPRVQQNKVV